MTSTLRTASNILCLAAILAALHGCAPLTATGAAVSGDRRSTGTVFDDEQIESKAHDFFNADQELVQACHINATSYNQQVLLSGECPTDQLRQKAAEYTKRVGKVRNIFNEIALAAPSTLTARSADGLITTKVRAKLLTINDLPGSNIKVVTEAGVVFMMGLVDEASGNAAAEAAATVGGVAKVVKLFEHP
ncbi:MAG: BON domain-containing protein [Gammaproteobacteria bacterium]|nr:BON domain-containing protein [Gammaproteobacteria bacterium]MCP5199521.1 BON domain-containing protein [Gammaproteobacteria bacterium]